MISRAGNKFFDDDGYTLAELLVVLAIVSLVLIAVPMFRMSDGVRLQQNIETLRNDLIALRIYARTQGEVGELIIKSDGYELSALSLTRTFDDGTLMSSLNESDLRFYPQGGSSGGTLQLQMGEREVALNVDWLTARVDIMDAGEVL